MRFELNNTSLSTEQKTLKQNKLEVLPIKFLLEKTYSLIYGEYDLFHTHISSFFSVILYGGYSERIWNGGEDYTERSVNFWNKKRHDEVHSPSHQIVRGQI